MAPHLLSTLRQARVSGIKVPVPTAALTATLAGLPGGVTIALGRIEVRFESARDAVGRLFALAHVLTNDHDRFEDLVGKKPT